jgi:hypothetical protein
MHQQVENLGYDIRKRKKLSAAEPPAVTSNYCVQFGPNIFYYGKFLKLIN